MALPRLRMDLDFMRSPYPDQPGLLVRDIYRYSNDTLIIPPPLVQCLTCFDGTQAELELQAQLTRSLGAEGIDGVAKMLTDALSNAGFLEDETYRRLKADRHRAFADSPVREAAYAGSGYPTEVEALRETMRGYIGAAVPTGEELVGIAAPHVSPQGGWQSYKAAYSALTPDLSDRTFVILGTSHYGQPNRFGLTRKPFATPFGRTKIDGELVAELALQPAALKEDYCHAIEHSIEFQVVFLQSIYGPEVRILPILCGPFVGRSCFPEDDQGLNQFFAALGEIAARETDRLFWVLGVDMAHMGVRYGDDFAALAGQNQMAAVEERDQQRIACINQWDARGYWDLVRENGDDLKWCGASAFYTFMKSAPQARGTLRRYEQWNIDEASVVSFAGITFSGG